MKRNPHLQSLKKNYLFLDVAKRVQQFRTKYPDRKLISLSVGDTTAPLPKNVSQGLVEKAEALGTKEGYQGYGPEQGDPVLRENIKKHFYPGLVESDDIFISDGAKCDFGRLMACFGSGKTIALQDPTYPAYLDASLLFGAHKIHFLPCTKENAFSSEFQNLRSVDLIFFCSPNNPIGNVASYDELTSLVKLAKEKNAFILFDAAYAPYIQEPDIPRSIYEIPGSEEVAIEVGSFSKHVGFTGVRLGWTVIPKALKYEDGKSVKEDWKRTTTTLFNGASILSQAGGIASLSREGLEEIQKCIAYYLKNTQLLKEVLQKKGYPVYGGTNAPYIWVDFGEHDSWKAFDTLLLTKGIITTPGVGFGKAGEGFVRFTGFGRQETILEAIRRLENDRMDW